MRFSCFCAVGLACLLAPAALAQQTVPEFSLRDLDNREVYYSDLQGERLTIIDFWATWCSPCLAAIPKLVDFAERYADRGVRFIGINVDGPRSLSVVKPVAHSLGITYPVLMDDNSEVMGLLSVDKMPTLLIVDADGNVLAFHEGYAAGDAEKLADELDALLTDE